MLKQRVITALAIIVPAFLLIIFAPDWLFGLLVVIVVAVGAWEWTRLSGLVSPVARATYLVAVLILLGALVGSGLVTGWSSGHLVILLLAVLWWLFVFLALAWYQVGVGASPLGRLLLRAAGLLTLVPAGLALVWIHTIDPMLVLYLVLLVAVADTGAYFAGRRFGRSRLAPEISPGKTREGLFGALLAVVLFGLLGAWLFGLEAMDALLFGLLSIVVALVSVAGDLQESVLKREAGAKDSGTLLPGHGGVLDRVDSLTAAAPVFLFGLLWTALLPGSIH